MEAFLKGMGQDDVMIYPLLFNIIPTVIFYFILKERYKYIQDNITNVEKIILAVMPIFPFLFIAPFAHAVWHDRTSDKPERVEESKNMEAAKEILMTIAYWLVVIAGMAGYIMNIVEMIKYGSVMATSSIVFGVVGVIFPPLGSIMGLLYMF